MLKTTRGKKIPWEQSQERSNPVLATPTSPHAGFWSPRRSHCSCLSSPHSVCSRGILTKATSQRRVHFSSCGQHAGPVSSLAPPSFRLSPPCPAPGFVPHPLPRGQCAGADSRVNAPLPANGPIPRLPRGHCAGPTSDQAPPQGLPFLLSARHFFPTRSGGLAAGRCAEREFPSFERKPAFHSPASYRDRGRRGPPHPHSRPFPLVSGCPYGPARPSAWETASGPPAALHLRSMWTRHGFLMKPSRAHQAP